MIGQIMSIVVEKHCEKPETKKTHGVDAAGNWLMTLAGMQLSGSGDTRVKYVAEDSRETQLKCLIAYCQ